MAASYKIGDDINVIGKSYGFETTVTGKVIGFIVDVAGKGLEIPSSGAPIKYGLTTPLMGATAYSVKMAGGRRKRRVTRRRR